MGQEESVPTYSYKQLLSDVEEADSLYPNLLHKEPIDQLFPLHLLEALLHFLMYPKHYVLASILSLLKGKKNLLSGN
jgi:hypothetical protein